MSLAERNTNGNMTEDVRVSSEASTLTAASSSSASPTSKPRRKRKWDQPAESVLSSRIATPGILPLGNMGPFVGVPLSGVAPVPVPSLMNPLVTGSGAVPPVFQPKIQDELIAREIVINDAESSVRYKLTKRQMQEEIQKSTGAVVITRGKYRPPNLPPNGEKPLYLHISAGAHLKDTTERIIAVDRAAAMVDEMLKQSHCLLQVPSTFLSTFNNGVNVLSTCVFLGFEADPALNIAARIRGPNDQYISHIINETGATVLLRGHGSGNLESSSAEEGQQPLHLFLSSSNPKSLDDAKLLAENLLDTISTECGAYRVSSSKVYNAVPPPQQLLAGVQNSGSELNSSTITVTSTSANSGSKPAPLVSSDSVTVSNNVLSQGGLLNCGQPQPNIVCYSQPPLTSGTSYNGYGGIYPQATPLQQVALALRHSQSPVSSPVSPITSATDTASKAISRSSSEKDKRIQQRRKFQELPVASKDTAKSDQGCDPQERSVSTGELLARNLSTMPASKKFVKQSYNGVMPPPPPKNMLPPPRTNPLPRPVRTTSPPRPPKFTSSMPVPKEHENNNILKKPGSVNVSDTLVKLMEYGDDDDDPEESPEELQGKTKEITAPKPFWAI